MYYVPFQSFSLTVLRFEMNDYLKAYDHLTLQK